MTRVLPRLAINRHVNAAGRFHAFTALDAVFGDGKKGSCSGGQEGGVAQGFRNSIHCSTPTRAENTSVEPASNQRPPSSSEPRPPAYISRSAVSSAGHWHNNRLTRQYTRGTYFIHAFISAVLNFTRLKQWQTQKLTPSRISLPR